MHCPVVRAYRCLLLTSGPTICAARPIARSARNRCQREADRESPSGGRTARTIARRRICAEVCAQDNVGRWWKVHGLQVRPRPDVTIAATDAGGVSAAPTALLRLDDVRVIKPRLLRSLTMR